MTDSKSCSWCSFSHSSLTYRKGYHLSIEYFILGINLRFNSQGLHRVDGHLVDLDFVCFFSALFCLGRWESGRMGRAPWQQWWKQPNLSQQQIVYEVTVHPVLLLSSYEVAGIATAYRFLLVRPSTYRCGAISRQPTNQVFVETCVFVSSRL